MTDRDDAAQLLQDARLVLNYLVRTGAVVNEPFLAAIERLEKALREDCLSACDYNSLATMLSHHVRSIAPVTLFDLGSGSSLFPRHGRHRVGRVLFSIFATLLILATGYYTLLYGRAKTVVSALAEVQSADVLDKTEHLYRLYMRDPRRLVSSDPADDEQFEPYLRSYEDVVKLNDDVTTYSPIADNLLYEADGGIFESLLEKLHLLGKSNAPGAQEGAGEALHHAPDDKLPYVGNLETDAPASAPPVVGVRTQQTQSLTQRDATQIWKQNQDNLAEFLYISGVGSLQSVAIADESSIGLANRIWKCNELLNYLGMVIVPMLYGLLGATIYQMRSILSPLLPTPPFEQVVLRLALGGLAGISAALVLGQLSDSLFSAKFSGFAVFTIAFVLGFSVDVFYAALDRLVGLVSKTIERWGLAQTQQPD